MEHLIDKIVWLQDKVLLRGFVFGLIHVGIMLIGFYTGWSINRLLKIVSNGFIAGIVGVVIALGGGFIKYGEIKTNHNYEPIISKRLFNQVCVG